jgi:hypothetical protein
VLQRKVEMGGTVRKQLSERERCDTASVSEFLNINLYYDPRQCYYKRKLNYDFLQLHVPANLSLEKICRKMFNRWLNVGTLSVFVRGNSLFSFWYAFRSNGRCFITKVVRS